MQADRVTYNTLLKACMRSNLADKALQTYEQMLHLKLPVSPLALQLNTLHSQQSASLIDSTLSRSLFEVALVCPTMQSQACLPPIRDSFCLIDNNYRMWSSPLLFHQFAAFAVMPAV